MYRSVAEVCRRIDINRQQFNKYLGGQAAPSTYNLRKICDFFGVEEREIYGDHDAFADLFSKKKPDVSSVDLDRGGEEFFPSSTESLRKYIGYYFAYVVQPTAPGQIIKSISRLTLVDGKIATKTYEKISTMENEEPFDSVNKYRGFAYEASEMIYLVEKEYLSDRGYIFSALYPSFRNRLKYLNGLVLGVSGANFRQPFGAQIAFEYLGEKIDLRRCLKACGCYSTASDEIPDEIKSLILIDSEPDKFMIRPPLS